MKIGIVTISYNQAAYLQEAIDSVQVPPPHELQYVMVDPGSTDGSREIIERNRQRFHAVILDRDRGPADGLNKGFAACDADIFGYINSDDRISPDALGFVCEFFAQHPDVELIAGSCAIIDAHGRPQSRKRVSWNLSVQHFIDHTSIFIQQACFFRRSAFLKTTGFSIQNRFSWDGELVLDMMLAGVRPVVVQKVMGEFRVYGNTITSELQKNGPSQPWKDNEARILGKANQAGFSKSSNVRRFVINLLSRCHPVRRLREYLAR